jgi:hypothetical protein
MSNKWVDGHCSNPVWQGIYVENMTHYCEFPTFPDLNGGETECGQPACAKVNGHWFCVLHEDAADNLEPNEQDAALDDPLD